MRAGLATLDITPPFLMPMGGFGMRLDHADGTHDPLTLTAVYLEQAGKEAWVISSDIVQFPDGQPFTENAGKVAARLGCPAHALFLNASHTHGGPEMLPELGVGSPAEQAHRSAGNQVLIRKYGDFLWEQTARACEEARARAAEARLVYGEGPTTFPMNRRAMINGRIENAPNPGGPIDERLRLLGIENAEGRMVALGLILAAHPTSTGPQHQYTADFVGAWREAFRKSQGDEIVPFFLQACGGDARPGFTQDGDHWRRANLDELPLMGEHLLRESLAVLEKGLTPLPSGEIGSASTTIELPCQPLYTAREHFASFLKSSISWERDFAIGCLQRLDRGENIPDRRSLDLTCLNLAKDLFLLGLGCEPLCAMGWKIENAFPGQTAMVLGYTNGCFGYLPETEELQRGGYEAEGYQFAPLCGPFYPGVEDVVIQACREVREAAAGG